MCTIAHAEQHHVPGIAHLLAELNAFYGDATTEEPEQQQEAIRAMLFNNPPSAYALIAHIDGQLAGMATYSFLWPAAGTTRSLYLKELYVRSDYRHRGVGMQLMTALCEIALQRQCSRVEWTTDRGNEGAQAFYRFLGAPIHEGKVFYRLEGDSLLRAQGRVSPGDGGEGASSSSPRVGQAIEPIPAPPEDVR